MTKEVVSLLRRVADDIETGKYNPSVELFDWDSTVKITVPTIKYLSPVEIDIFFFKIKGRKPREMCINHWLNTINQHWNSGSSRYPLGYQALQDVAIDCKVSMEILCNNILMHPRFSKNAIGDAAQEYIDTLK